MTRTVTLQLPENIYFRLQQAAQATKQSLEEIFLRALQVGCPPGWDDVPAEFQADIAALDRLDNSALWRVARSRQSVAEAQLYQELLDKKADGTLSVTEAQQLAELRNANDRQIKRGLPADGRQQRVGPFFGDNRGHGLDGQRLNIRAVCGFGVGHNRGRIGINQHHDITFLPQSLARLGAGIVKLASLPDNDRAAADN